MRPVTRRLIFPLLLFCLSASPLLAAVDSIPEVLRPWIPWVQDQDKTRLCPARPGHPESPLCIWPRTLRLDLAETEGAFAIQWELFAESAVPLPGDGSLPPREVRVNGKAHPLLMEKGKPVVYLKPGVHDISGRFLWPRMPDTLQLPPEIGEIRIFREKAPFNAPLRDEKGRIWLRPPPAAPEKDAARSHTDIRIHRRIQDGHPMEVETRVQLAVSGDPRQETLPIPMPRNAALVRVESPLPLKPSMAEGLVLDLKPGNFTLRFIHLLPATEREFVISGRRLEEIWVFVPQPDLRAAELQGGQSLDPRQTTLPEDWKSSAAYAIAPEARPVLHVRESRQTPAEDPLNLQRDVWLDFSGQGVTVRDQIRGTLRDRRYLGMDASGPLLPGRITQQGEDRLITRNNNLQGIELPPGPLSLTVLSRMEGSVSGTALPAGWQTPMDTLDLTLHLPPGWHLATLRGGQVEGPDSLFSRWTLLDFFFLVLLSGAALKLWGRAWGLAFILGVAFFHHSFPLPLPFWFSLAATAALGKFFAPRKTPAWILGGLSVIHLLLLLAASLAALPYAAEQIRTGLYPQLENLPKSRHFSAGAPSFPDQSLPAQESMNEGAVLLQKSLRAPAAMDMAQAPPEMAESRKKVSPPPVTQTGPGDPTWQWRSIPVQTGFPGPGHTLVLYLIPPLAASLAAFLRVLLVALVLGRLAAGFPYTPPTRFRNAGAVLALLLFGLQLPDAARADYPPEYLLRELKEKLRVQDACHPHCVRSGPAVLKLDAPDQKAPLFILDMELHAGSSLAFALPGTDLPLPGPSFFLNGEKPPVLRTNGQNFIVLSPGVHTLRMTGSLPAGRFRLDFPHMPDSLSLTAPGWRVEGLDADGRIRDLLLFTPEGKHLQEKIAEEPEVLPFVRVHRTLHRGREWEVRTTLVRAYPGNRQARIRIPLLPGETVLREGLLVRDGHVEVRIPAYGQSLSWNSRLPETDEVRLHMARTMDFSESWEILGDTDRHLTFSGDTAPPRPSGRGLVWRPLPGQHLLLSFPVLPPAPGPTLTAENLWLKREAGRERGRLRLEALIRSGKAVQHPVEGPENGLLQEIRINGEAQPLPRDREPLLLALTPGSHTLQITWEMPESGPAFFPRHIRMPHLNLGMPTANILQEIQLDKGQWLLWTHGPLLGPGVRIWGWIVLVLAASLLAALKAKASPLHTRDWVLLGLGLAPLSPLAILLVVGGFFLIQWREGQTRSMGRLHNLWQCGLALLLLVMACILLAAVRNGLLGVPDMQIAGNGSTPHLLRWTADRSAGAPPPAGVFLLPLSFWRVLMFAWALWLAARILSWTPWAWKALLTGVSWRHEAPQDTGLRLDLNGLDPPAAAAQTGEDAGKKP